MKKLTKTIGLTVLAVLMATPALAKPGHHRGKHKGDIFTNPKLLERAAGKIGLSDDVLSQIKEKVYRAQKASIEWKGQLKSKKLDLRHELDSANPNRGRVMDLVEESGELHIKLKKHRLSLMLEIRSMLTPEQIKKAKRLRREFRAKHQRRRNRHNKAGGAYLNQSPREQKFAD